MARRLYSPRHLRLGFALFICVYVLLSSFSWLVETKSVSAALDDNGPITIEDVVDSPQPKSATNTHEGDDDIDAFYRDRFLPRPQLELPTDKQLRYQTISCTLGRDGSKHGLRDAGFAWSSAQRTTGLLSKVFADSQVLLSCNNAQASRTVTRDPRLNGKRLISTSVGLWDEDCLGAGKIAQALCYRKLASQSGCDFNDLGIQPPQFILSIEEDCNKVMEILSDPQQDKPWLIKPSVSLRGHGIRFFKDSTGLLQEINRYGGCGAKSRAMTQNLVQEYVVNPALLDDGRYKFDVRSWLLVASVDPLLIFYHDGFVRVAKNPYEESSSDLFAHITNLKGSERSAEEGSRERTYLRTFAQASKALTERFGMPENFMQNQFRKKAVRAQVFAALSQFARPVSANSPARKGFYHSFACDYIVDRMGGVHMLECNGFPAEGQQTAVENRLRGGGQPVWNEALALVLNLHLEPWRLMTDASPPRGGDKPLPEYPRRGLWKNTPKIRNGEALRQGKYAFGGWQLSFNELETPFNTVNACTDFQTAVRGQDEIDKEDKREGEEVD